MQRTNVSELTSKSQIEGESRAQFSNTELKRMRSYLFSTNKMYVYLALKLEMQEFGNIHAQRFCRNWGIARKTLTRMLGVFRQQKFVDFTATATKREYQVYFLLEEQ